MLTDSTTGKVGIDLNNKVEISEAPKAKTDTETHKAASGNSQESPTKAPENNKAAKEAALGAVTRFYQESENAEKKAEKMVSELEDVIQLALLATRKSCGIVDKEAEHDRNQATIRHKPVELDLATSSSVDFAADAEKAASGAKKPADDEVKAEFYRLLMLKNPRLRHFIDDLTEEKAKIKVEKIASEAKSEIIAARVAVNRAQEEINSSKEQAKKALLDSQATQQAAELMISQVKQDAMSQSASEVARAHAEVKAIQEAANAAVKRAEEEVKKSRDEVTTLSDYVKETLALAQEKVRKSAEELKSCKFQAQAAIAQAQEDAKKARAEAEEVRREAKTALGKAALETQQAKADMELARRTMQEANVIAEKQAYEKIYDEMKQMREEVDATNKKAHEVIAKAQAETQQAKQELEALKKNTEKDLNEARNETLEARKESEKAKQSVKEAIDQAELDGRRAREEAEKAIIKANEAITQAKKDVINLTRGEIVRARLELEAPNNLNESSIEGGIARNADANLNVEHIASILHEMRNPLHSISGFAKIMLDENPPDDNTRKEFLNIMVQQSESLNKLIDDLSGSLNDNGNSETFKVNKTTVSPVEVINQAIDSVQTTAQQKKNLINCDLGAPLPEIEADAFRLKQVIVNLLTNAIKFSPENSSIHISAEVRDKELRIKVMDHGIGISQADIPAIFDRRYRGSNGDEAEGSGLGLYICRQIVEAHGGRIWAESAVGEGSIFTFSLPLASASR